MGTIAKERKPKAAKTETETQEAAALENAIMLRPTNMQPGIIEMNAGMVLEAVRERTRQYLDVSKYTDDRQAKADRAMLRKQKDHMKTVMASIREAYNKPLEQAELLIRQASKEFDVAIDTIDEHIKEGEAREKEAKREAIQAYFDGRDFDLVPLEKIFDAKWLNKTTDMRDVKNAIVVKISEIHANLKILESVAEHGAVAKAFYLDTLDMAAALRQGETLKANAERAAREKRERAEREARENVARNAAQEAAEARQAEKEANIDSLVAEALGEDPAEAKPEIYEFDYRFRGTADDARKMKAYMTGNKIAYEKLAERVVE